MMPSPKKLGGLVWQVLTGNAGGIAGDVIALLLG
jgi:hypothetical protein